MADFLFPTSAIAATPPKDTTEIARKFRIRLPSKDSSELMSEVLLANHPLFTDHWINDEAFVFEDVTYEDLPDEVFIPLLEGNGSFKITWYGKLNSAYKKRWGRYHQGLDLQLHTGDNIYAAFDGVVRYAQYNQSGYGNCIIIRHLNGLETVYGHLSKINVKPNEYVNAGDAIGLGGSTGHSYGPHLHFETRYKDFSFNPELIFNLENQSLQTENLILEKKQFL
jgi:murein DD-endopeptidase MepM/ murein hydrolase activator NlpD